MIWALEMKQKQHKIQFPEVNKNGILEVQVLKYISFHEKHSMLCWCTVEVTWRYLVEAVIILSLTTCSVIERWFV